MKVDVRQVVESDITDLLAVEFDRYGKLYSENPKKRNQIESIFRKRFQIAGDWMWVVTLDGRVRGFISGQPTSKQPEDFISWEESTNHGTLEGTFDVKGRNVYVVNLDVQREATKLEGQYMLMATIGARVVRENKDLVMFESRMPRFRDWVKDNYEGGIVAFERLSDNEKLEVAIKYSRLTKVRGTKEGLYDSLLNFYNEAGFSFIKVVPEAFQDGESLNFGMLCVAKNPIPKLLRHIPVNVVVAYLLKKFGKNPELLAKFVG